MRIVFALLAFACASLFSGAADAACPAFPFVAGKCIEAGELNNAFALNRGATPPNNGEDNSTSGATHGALWLDTSGSPYVLRQCKTAPSCSTSYTATQWTAWATIDATTEAITFNSASTNAALAALPIAAYPNGVWRLDYAAGNGAPPLFYRPQNLACSLNSGNGDNGSQVKSSDSKCWIAQWPDHSHIDIRQFGAKADGTTDAAPFIQTAFTAHVGRLYAPGSIGVWKINSTVTASDWPFQLIGDYPQEIQNTNICPTGTPAGTWFHFTNASTSRFLIQEGSTPTATQGTELSNFAICQTQPTPGGGWAPTVYPPAITLSDTQGCLLNRIYWYGVYDAISANNSARCTISEQRGQFFHQFWIADHLLDVTFWHNWHLWPFWADNSNVIDWQKANGTVATIYRMDGLGSNNLFALGYKEVIHFSLSPNAYGPAAAISINNLYCDAVKYCIHVDSDAGSTVASFGNTTLTGIAVAGSVMVEIAGGATNLSISSMYCLAPKTYCVNVTGPNSFVGIGWAYALNYDDSNVGAAAFRANSTNPSFPAWIALGQSPTGSITFTGSGPVIDTTTADGAVTVGGWYERTWTPQLTFGGAHASMTTSTATGRLTVNPYTGQILGNTKIVLTAKGASTGNAAVTLPALPGNPTLRDTVGTVFMTAGTALAAPIAFIPAAAAASTSIQLLDNSGGTGWGFLQETNFTDTTSLIASIH